MPRTRNVEVGGELITKTTTMASGRVVEDIVGWKPTVTASWEYVPSDTMQELVALVKLKNRVMLTYPAPDGNQSGEFKIEIGNQKIFKFVNGVPMWQNVTLKAVAVEVE